MTVLHRASTCAHINEQWPSEKVDLHSSADRQILGGCKLIIRTRVDGP